MGTSRLDRGCSTDPLHLCHCGETSGACRCPPDNLSAQARETVLRLYGIDLDLVVPWEMRVDAAREGRYEEGVVMVSLASAGIEDGMVTMLLVPAGGRMMKVRLTRSAGASLLGDVASALLR